jgi:hypothetical protein
MYRRPHVICVAALVCQSGPALAIREPGSACGIRVGQNQFPPLQALWNGESGWRPNALNPASGAYGIHLTGNSPDPGLAAVTFHRLSCCPTEMLPVTGIGVS